MVETKDIYSKLLDARLVLRDTAEYFRIYSAQDMNRLIEAAIHNKKKVPAGIKALYDLEQRIMAVRAAIDAAREGEN
jgi:hypothetical protein